jgi:hypothetical protein
MPEKTDNINGGTFMKQLILLLLFCIMLIPATGYCELYGVHSALKDGLTVAVPIHSNETMKAYATADILDSAICWQGYPEDGKFFMRVYYECNNQKCKDELAKNFKDGVTNQQIERFGGVNAEHVYFWSADTVFDLPRKKAITGTEMFFDKWGYIMGSLKHNPPIEEELNELRPFAYELATKINNILSTKLREAKENPHSCLYMERRIINPTRQN